MRANRKTSRLFLAVCTLVVVCVASLGLAGPAEALARHDLVVSQLGDPPTGPARGEAFNVHVVVQNDGTRATKPSTVRFYASADSTVDSGDTLLTQTAATPRLAKRSSFASDPTLHIPIGLPNGTFFLIACADDKQVVSESDETNNCRASSGQFTLTTDTTPPTVSITNPIGGSTTASTLLIQFIVSSDTTSVTCILDTDTISPARCDLTGSFLASNLIDGTHEIRVTAYDAAANSYTKVADWTVDATAPLISSVTATPTSSTSEHVTFSVSDASAITEIHCVLFTDGGTGDDQPCGSGASGSVDYTGLAGHAYTLEIYAVDVYGNSGATASAAPAPSTRAQIALINNS